MNETAAFHAVDSIPFNGNFFIVYDIYLQVVEFMCTSFNCFKLFQYLPDPSSS